MPTALTAQKNRKPIWGNRVRTISLLQAKIKIGMINMGYNMVRLVQRVRRDGIGTPAIGKESWITRNTAGKQP